MQLYGANHFQLIRFGFCARVHECMHARPCPSVPADILGQWPALLAALGPALICEVLAFLRQCRGRSWPVGDVAQLGARLLRDRGPWRGPSVPRALARARARHCRGGFCHAGAATLTLRLVLACLLLGGSPHAPSVCRCLACAGARVCTRLCVWACVGVPSQARGRALLSTCAGPLPVSHSTSKSVVAQSPKPRRLHKGAVPSAGHSDRCFCFWPNI